MTPRRWQEGLGRVVGFSRSPQPDLWLALSVTALAALLWWEARKIPPPFFDPLGSAAIPKAIAVVLVVIACVLSMRAVAGLGAVNDEAPIAYRPRPDLVIGIFALCVVYVGSMDLGWIGFEAATIAFLIAAAALLGRLHLRTLLLGSLIALVMGVGGTWLFTRFFFIDLPR